MSLSYTDSEIWRVVSWKSHFFPPDVRYRGVTIESSRRSFRPQTYRAALIAWRYVQAFWVNTSLWWTDRQTAWHGVIAYIAAAWMSLSKNHCLDGCGEEWGCAYGALAPKLCMRRPLANRMHSLEVAAKVTKLHFYSAPQCSHCKRCTSYSNSVCLSMCLSVRLSHAGIVSKRRHVARCSLHCRIAKCI